jgi:hypothetical protein
MRREATLQPEAETMSEPQLYRLWVGEEDFGTAAERQAKLWLQAAAERHPGELVFIEPVDANAPVFLKQPASACCGAPVRLAGGAREGTHYFICAKCSQACSVAEPVKPPKEPEQQQHENHQPEAAAEAPARPLLVDEIAAAAAEQQQQNQNDEDE